MRSYLVLLTLPQDVHTVQHVCKKVMISYIIKLVHINTHSTTTSATTDSLHYCDRNDCGRHKQYFPLLASYALPT